eukprot:gene11928-15963_t
MLRFSKTISSHQDLQSNKEDLENILLKSVKTNLVLWSSDFHISPIADIKHLLQSSSNNNNNNNSKYNNLEIIDKSLSGHCHLTNTCATDLRIINQKNGIRLSPCANKIRESFFNSYYDDEELQNVDAFLCTHAASLCEIFMPFDKPMVIIASTRYENGRFDAKSWTRWNENLIKIASKPYNIIAANNLYDLEYMKYFTPLNNIILLPNFCNYVNTRYNPTKKSFLIGPSRGINEIIYKQLVNELTQFNNNHNNEVFLHKIHDIYPSHYEYSDLASHFGMILLPYQVSVMSFFEYYRMEIPLFVPSPELLTNWHINYQVLNERSWAAVFNNPSSKSILSRHANSTSTMQFDPNNEFSVEAVLEWIKLSDFYQWPHITQFNSFNQLFQHLEMLINNKQSKNMLKTNNILYDISNKMHDYNIKEEINIRNKWNQILDIIKQRKIEKENIIIKNPVVHDHYHDSNINEQLKRLYGYQLSKTDCNAQINIS